MCYIQSRADKTVPQGLAPPTAHEQQNSVCRFQGKLPWVKALANQPFGVPIGETDRAHQPSVEIARTTGQEVAHVSLCGYVPRVGLRRSPSRSTGLGTSQVMLC